MLLGLLSDPGFLHGLCEGRKLCITREPPRDAYPLISEPCRHSSTFACVTARHIKYTDTTALPHAQREQEITALANCPTPKIHPKPMLQHVLLHRTCCLLDTDTVFWTDTPCTHQRPRRQTMTQPPSSQPPARIQTRGHLAPATSEKHRLESSARDFTQLPDAAADLIHQFLVNWKNTDA